jgi:hypothetical protein
MSGAEAIAVLSLISSIIAVVDGTRQVYDAARNAEGLPSAFREVAGKLPLVRVILDSAKKHINDGEVDEQSCEAMESVVKGCKDKVEKLRILFQKVLPPDNASLAERYFKAVRTAGKGGKVETLMKEILVDVQLLTSSRGIKTAISDQVDQINKAIKEVSEAQPSVAESDLETEHVGNIFVNPSGQVKNMVVGQVQNNFSFS